MDGHDHTRSSRSLLDAVWRPSCSWEGNETGAACQQVVLVEQIAAFETDCFGHRAYQEEAVGSGGRRRQTPTYLDAVRIEDGARRGCRDARLQSKGFEIGLRQTPLGWALL